MKHLLTAVAIFACAVLRVLAAEQNVVQGMLLKIDRANGVVLVSCSAVPGHLDAMVMEFTVRERNELNAMEAGTSVRFNMVKQDHKVYAEHLQRILSQNVEAEPTEAARLTLLQRSTNPASAAHAISVGGEVPDFTLSDQTQRRTRLTDSRGKVVVLSFTYSRCPNPSYCFRLSNNLAILQKRFPESMGRDLILMTIVIDPDNDRGKALQDYADIWRANPKSWRFLTGSLAEVRNVAELFGMNFWNDEGFLTHPFHTVVIDRSDRLVANIEGNQFTATQLGDLVQTLLRSDPPIASSSQSVNR